MGLKTKSAGGRGACRGIIDSNKSLLSILTPKHFFAVSAICFDRSDLACTWYKLGVFVYLVELHEVADGVGMTRLKTVEALR